MTTLRAAIRQRECTGRGELNGSEREQRVEGLYSYNVFRLHPTNAGPFTLHWSHRKCG
jgi:hypothetical protein